MILLVLRFLHQVITIFEFSIIVYMWEHPKELKHFDKPVIYWTWNDKCGIFKDNICHINGQPDSDEINFNRWMRKVEKYNIKWFEYVDDIRPCGILGNGGSLKDWYGCDEEDITREMWDAIGNHDDDLIKKMCNNLKNNKNNEQHKRFQVSSN